MAIWFSTIGANTIQWGGELSFQHIVLGQLDRYPHGNEWNNPPSSHSIWKWTQN